MTARLTPRATADNCDATARNCILRRIVNVREPPTSLALYAVPLIVPGNWKLCVRKISLYYLTIKVKFLYKHASYNTINIIEAHACRVICCAKRRKKCAFRGNRRKGMVSRRTYRFRCLVHREGWVRGHTGESKVDSRAAALRGGGVFSPPAAPVRARPLCVPSDHYYRDRTADLAGERCSLARSLARSR